MTNMKKHANKQNNNLGFSLIELLIAISILAVAIVPMIHGFVSSIRLNSRTRGKLDSAMVAQDLMEGVRNSTHEKTEEQFWLVNDKSKEDGSEHIPTEEEWKKFTLLPIDILQTSGTDKTVFDMTVDKKNITTLRIKNLKAGSSNLKYDALITIDPTRYQDERGVKNSKDDLINYNSDSLATLTNMGSSADCIFNGDNIIKDVYRDGIVIEARTFLSNEDSAGNYDNLGFEDLTRKFVINVTREEEEGNSKDVVKLATYYYCPKITTKAVASSADKIIFSRPTDTNPLKNLFFIYYPGYDLYNMSDTIELNNMDGIKFNFFILKQLRTDLSQSYSDDVTYVSGQDGHGIHVVIKESSKGSVTVNSNLDINASTGEEIFSESEKNVRKANIFEWYVGDNPSNLSGSDDFQPFKMVGTGDSTDRIYDVKVWVYEEGYWMETEVSGNKDPFGDTNSDKKLLTTLDSSMLTH